MFYSLVGCLVLGAQAACASDFTVKPYLQLGNQPSAKNEAAAEVMWIVNENQNKWRLEAKEADEKTWRAQKPPKYSVAETPARSFIVHSQVTGLKPGEPFQYRLFENETEVFKAEGMAPKAPDQPYSVALFGDMGANTDPQRKVAYQVYKKKPDLLIMLGDIVYDFGLFHEYLKKFFPIYNCDDASEHVGAPLMRSTILASVLGNHDVALGANPSGIDLDKMPDGLAYFHIWSGPLNGPLADPRKANVPKLLGGKEAIASYLHETDGKYPRLANYSFDYGNAHWLVLDANPYMDWTNESLRNWVEQDLQKASNATWKFVCFHQPGFSLDVSHYKEQRMRLLCDVFERAGVDVVFSGHAHNYQRTFPLYFKAKSENGHLCTNPDGTVDGEFTFDKSFDGSTVTVPKGIIYIVSGAGGAKLYPSVQQQNPLIQKTFTDRFICDTHSFTFCEVSGTSLKICQVSEDGKILDQYTVKKSAGKEAKPIASKRHLKGL